MERRVCGCLYFPLRRRPAGAHRASSSKIRFPHILPPQNRAGGSRALRSVALRGEGGLEDLKKPSFGTWPFFQASPEGAKLGNSHSLNDPKGARVLLWGGHNQSLRDVWVTDTYFINNLTYTKCLRESLTGWLLTAPDNSRGGLKPCWLCASTEPQKPRSLSHPRDVIQINKYNYLHNLKCQDNTVKSFPPSAVTCGKQIGKYKEQLGNLITE